jgi:hypothetical protein
MQMLRLLRMVTPARTTGRPHHTARINLCANCSGAVRLRLTRTPLIPDVGPALLLRVLELTTMVTTLLMLQYGRDVLLLNVALGRRPVSTSREESVHLGLADFHIGDSER